PASSFGSSSAPGNRASATLSLHAALPISRSLGDRLRVLRTTRRAAQSHLPGGEGTRQWPHASPLGGRASTTRLATVSNRSRLSQDRKSTRLNSSHVSISYAVFCLKKKKHG